MCEPRPVQTSITVISRLFSIYAYGVSLVFIFHIKCKSRRVSSYKSIINLMTSEKILTAFPGKYVSSFLRLSVSCCSFLQTSITFCFLVRLCWFTSTSRTELLCFPLDVSIYLSGIKRTWSPIAASQAFRQTVRSWLMARQSRIFSQFASFFVFSLFKRRRYGV